MQKSHSGSWALWSKCFTKTTVNSPNWAWQKVDIVTTVLCHRHPFEALKSGSWTNLKSIFERLWELLIGKWQGSLIVKSTSLLLWQLKIRSQNHHQNPYSASCCFSKFYFAPWNLRGMLVFNCKNAISTQSLLIKVEFSHTFTEAWKKSAEMKIQNRWKSWFLHNK